MDRQNCNRPDGAVGRSRWRHALLAPLLGLALLSGASGCKIVLGVLWSLQGDPLQDCDFKQHTKKNLAEKGKKIVVLASVTGSASEYPSLAQDFAAEITRRFRSQKFKVIDSNEVSRFVDENGEITDATDLAELGPEFKADYIILFKFDEFHFQQPNSVNMLQGHAKGNAVVVEFSGKGDQRKARTIYRKAFNSQYPHEPVSTEQENKRVFVQRFIGKLSEELARYFYDHRPGEDI